MFPDVGVGLISSFTFSVTGNSFYSRLELDPPEIRPDPIEFSFNYLPVLVISSIDTLRDAERFE